MEENKVPTTVTVPPGKVKLIRGDEFVFLVDEDAARVSTTIRGMLDSEGMRRGKKEYDAGPAFSHTVLGGVCR